VKPNQLAKFAAVVLALAGVAALAASAAIALGSFQATGLTARRFDCGSIVSAKDPRSLAPKLAKVPENMNVANANCEKIRNHRTNESLGFMVAGVVPLLLVLGLPAISRASRRASGRRRRS
jgi:hypothetical protein